MSGDVTAAIEYLTAFAEHDEDTVRRADVRTVLAEVQRLRAEREALHSDETRAQVKVAVARAITDAFDVSHRDGAANNRGIADSVTEAALAALALEGAAS